MITFLLFIIALPILIPLVLLICGVIGLIIAFFTVGTIEFGKYIHLAKKPLATRGEIIFATLVISIGILSLVYSLIS